MTETDEDTTVDEAPQSTFSKLRHSAEFRDAAFHNPSLLFHQTGQHLTTTDVVDHGHSVAVDNGIVTDDLEVSHNGLVVAEEPPPYVPDLSQIASVAHPVDPAVVAKTVVESGFKDPVVTLPTVVPEPVVADQVVDGDTGEVLETVEVEEETPEVVEETPEETEVTEETNEGQQEEQESAEPPVS